MIAFPTDYVLFIAIEICIYYILAASYNLIAGVTGLSNFSMVASFGIGAYTTAILTSHAFALQLSFWIGLLAGSSLAAVAAFLLAIPSLRMHGDYYSIMTLGFSEVIRITLTNETWLSRGGAGIPSVPAPDFGPFYTVNNYAVLLLLYGCFAGLVLLLLERIIRSPYGRALRSIRDDELASGAMGKNTWAFKMQVTVLVGFFSGIAGVLYAHFTSYVYPNLIIVDLTVFILACSVLGGLGKNMGALFGVLIMVVAPELFRFVSLPADVVGPVRSMMAGSLLVFVILFRPEGILGRGRKPH